MTGINSGVLTAYMVCYVKLALWIGGGGMPPGGRRMDRNRNRVTATHYIPETQA